MKTSILMCHYGENIKMTEKCVKSLLNVEENINKIIVSNNNNLPLNSKYLKGNNKVVILNNGKNLGYPGGINKGLVYLLKHDTDLVFIINNDCVIEKPFLKDAISFMISNSKIKIVFVPLKFSKKEKYMYDIGGRRNRFGKLYHEEVESLANQKPHEIDFAGCFLLDLEFVKKVGFMDEDLFLYYDDIDYCLRGKKMGYLAYSFPKSYIFHGLSKTVGVGTPKANYHQTRSALIYAKKHLFPHPSFYVFNLYLLFTILKRLKNNPFAIGVVLKASKDGILTKKSKEFFL